MAKLRVVRAFSAGGVVFTYPHAAAEQQTPTPLALTQVVLVGHTREGIWMLPKGTPIAGESTQQTALREVREETGIEARIVGELGSIAYSFARRGTRFNKEVLHYLMEAMGGDVSLHDHEYDESRWFAYDAATRALTYTNEADVVRRAGALIAQFLAERHTS